MRELSELHLIAAAIGLAGVVGLVLSPRWKRLLGARLIMLARYQELMRGFRKVAWKGAGQQYENALKVASGVEVMTFPPVPEDWQGEKTAGRSRETYRQQTPS